MSSSNRVIVIGAGPAGILAGIKLTEQGVTDYTLLEKAPDLGGTWWYNRYPGIACDVPSAYYSYSFSPNTMAKRTFATGQDLLEYFRTMSDQYGVSPHIQFNTEVVDSEWDGTRWQLTTRDGRKLEAEVVISAVGRLHRPRFPDIPGADDFDGLIAHSAEWDQTVDLSGKRVGVIGAGSSAVQIVSSTAAKVKRLDLFQRTAQWIYPVVNEIIPEELLEARRLHPELAVQHYFAVEEELNHKVTGAVMDNEGVDAINRARACYEHLATVRDPKLRAKLTPDYEVGCKRLVMSGEFYDAVQRSNVDVVTDGILRIEKGGVRTEDGVLHELDVLILATGFHADTYMRPMSVRGEQGKTLDDIWADSYVNYKSVALPHMPNFFTINGPFSPGGSVSTLSIIESHVGYIMQLVERALSDAVAIAPDWDRSVELLDEVIERAKGTVWYTGGCSSWYLDKNGVPLVNPQTVAQLAADMTVPVLSDFRVSALVEDRDPVPR